MSFDVITKEHRPHPKLLAVVQKQLLLCHIESKIYPAALLKRPDLMERLITQFPFTNWTYIR